MPVRVVNVRDWKGNGIYIGRARDPRLAVFGNPYTHITGRDTLARFHVPTREDAIRMYRDVWVPQQWEENEYFRTALTSLVQKHLRGDEVVLACHCKPLPCHGDALAQVIYDLAELRVVKLNDKDEDNPF